MKSEKEEVNSQTQDKDREEKKVEWYRTRDWIFSNAPYFSLYPSHFLLLTFSEQFLMDGHFAMGTQGSLKGL